MSLGVNTLASDFDRKRNGIGAIRLALALGVIIWHSLPITGRGTEWGPAVQVLAHMWIDGFFAMSGFLVVGSWLHDPRPLKFVKSRALRILPAFYTCLIVTALILAPVAVILSGSGKPLWSGKSVTYVLKNSLLWIFQRDIAGATAGNPFPDAINGSLWTLSWEFLGYLAVLVLGVAKLLHRRLTLPLLFVASWLVLLACALGIFETRFTEPVSLFVVGAGVIVLACLGLPEYSLAAAPFLAYFLIAGAHFLRATGWP